MTKEEIIENTKFQFEFNAKQLGQLIGVVQSMRDKLQERHSDTAAELNEILNILNDWRQRRIINEI